MKEQLISLKTAILAKEKGFDVKVNALYSGEILFEQGNVQPPILELTNFNTMKDTSCSAPTQSLLQKWLREKHKCDIIINITSMTNEYWAYIPNFIIGNWTSKNCTTYEEALEKGLYEALKLLKK